MLQTRNVVLDGRRTTLRMERAIWQAFDELCVRERTSAGSVCAEIDRARRSGARAAAVRAVVTNYFRFALRDGVVAGGGALETAIREMAGEP